MWWLKEIVPFVIMVDVLFRLSELPSLSRGQHWEGTNLTLHCFVDDSIYLFVVNHPHYKSQVEIFRFVKESTLEHLKTITHPLLHRYTPCDEPSPNTATFYFESKASCLCSVNDVLAVGADSFYATNHASFPNEALHFLVSLLGLPWCDVVYYSPEEVRVAASGIMSANGINISPDRRLCIDSVCVPFHRNIPSSLAQKEMCDILPAGTFISQISWTMT